MEEHDCVFERKHHQQRRQRQRRDAASDHHAALLFACHVRSILCVVHVQMRRIFITSVSTADAELFGQIINLTERLLRRRQVRP